MTGLKQVSGRDSRKNFQALALVTGRLSFILFWFPHFLSGHFLKGASFLGTLWLEQDDTIGGAYHI